MAFRVDEIDTHTHTDVCLNLWSTGIKCDWDGLLQGAATMRRVDGTCLDNGTLTSWNMNRICDVHHFLECTYSWKHLSSTERITSKSMYVSSNHMTFIPNICIQWKQKPCFTYVYISWQSIISEAVAAKTTPLKSVALFLRRGCMSYQVSHVQLSNLRTSKLRYILLHMTECRTRHVGPSTLLATPSVPANSQFSPERFPTWEIHCFKRFPLQGQDTV